MKVYSSCRSGEHSCASDLAHAILPAFGSQLVGTSANGFRSRMRYQAVGPHLKILWGEMSHLSGVLMPKHSHAFLFFSGEGGDVIRFNGHALECLRDSLTMAVAPALEMFDLSIKSPKNCVIVMVDPLHFSSLYEVRTGSPADELLARPFCRFKTEEKLDAFLALTAPYLGHKWSRDPQQMAETASEKAIFKALVDGVELSPPPRGLNHCNNLALKAHQRAIATSSRKISLSEICEELGAASRSLQKGFKELYGMGFIEYHRVYRMHRLQKSIKSQGVRSGELLGFMEKFGFEHAGRFAVEYKKLFGVSPSKERKREAQGEPFIDDL